MKVLKYNDTDIIQMCEFFYMSEIYEQRAEKSLHYVIKSTKLKDIRKK